MKQWSENGQLFQLLVLLEWEYVDDDDDDDDWI